MGSLPATMRCSALSLSSLSSLVSTLLLLTAIVCLLGPGGGEADDVFACCMGGWKEIHGTVLCSAPCCPGYTMKVERPPLLAPLVYCRKEGVEGGIKNPRSKMHFLK